MGYTQNITVAELQLLNDISIKDDTDAWVRGMTTGLNLRDGDPERASVFRITMLLEDQSELVLDRPAYDTVFLHTD